LQPRVGVSLTSSRQSRFVQLYAEDAGIDPYTRVVSDAYQDCFGEGSFIGKGIYDVDSFELHCGDFPENTILSHDLIEGAYCRSGLLSDVTLYEDHPSRYFADIDRRHRWIRGDWQIAAWLLPWVRGRSGQYSRNPISALSRWKIFDNLRRSLAPVMVLLVLLLSWCISAGAAAAALLFVTGVLLLPVLLNAGSDLFSKPIDLPLRMHLRVTLQSLLRPIAYAALSLTFLPYEAWISVDAIGRTLLRMCWTKRRLLEWRTASDAERGADDNLPAAFRSMAVAPAIGIAAALLLAVFQREVLPIAVFWIVAWTASPLVAWWLSRPIHRRAIQLSGRQQRFLEQLSRRTWRYFEEFVTEEENWLPPDNIQQNPHLVVAPRTSPTNIGMALLSDLTACDFGYCSVAELLTRSRRTLDTLSRMERYRGHFFNWYDTQSLAPLHPHYVSTVDSGNLAASLLVLGSGFDEL
ncbi:MAG: cyclic beta 1-2 glucan synthetase, partial [Pirellulales bacterium]